MKKIKNVLLFSLLATIAYAQEIKFEQLEINYGKIALNAEGIRIFSFTNTGDTPLIINTVRSSCGCAVASWPKEPIMPQQSDVIKVKYDTKRVGVFTKFFTMESNDAKQPTIILRIKGEVLPQAERIENSEKR